MKHVTVDRADQRYYEGLDIYRVRTRLRFRRGVVICSPKRWWQRTWQAEWPGCERAMRGWTRNGALVRSVRRRARAAR